MKWSIEETSVLRTALLNKKKESMRELILRVKKQGLPHRSYSSIRNKIEDVLIAMQKWERRKIAQEERIKGLRNVLDSIADKNAD